MERIKVQYINEYREKKRMSGLAFVVFASLSFIVAVGAGCLVLWVIA